jgi:hypothetical protein
MKKLTEKTWQKKVRKGWGTSPHINKYGITLPREYASKLTSKLVVLGYDEFVHNKKRLTRLEIVSIDPSEDNWTRESFTATEIGTKGTSVVIKCKSFIEYFDLVKVPVKVVEAEEGYICLSPLYDERKEEKGDKAVA